VKDAGLWDLLIVDINAATLAGWTDRNKVAPNSHAEFSDRGIDRGYGLIEDAAIGIKDGLIAYCGSRQELPETEASLARSIVSGEHALATPGLVDCHTHLVYAGSRAREFEQRLRGAYRQVNARCQ